MLEKSIIKGGQHTFVRVEFTMLVATSIAITIIVGFVLLARTMAGVF